MTPRARPPILEGTRRQIAPVWVFAGLGNSAGREQPPDQLAALMEPLLFRNVELLVREFRFNVLEQHR